MRKILVFVFLITAIFTRPVLAADSWAIAAEALGVYAAYRSALSSMLEMGENVHAQVETRRIDLKENGIDENKEDNEIVNRIMTKLTQQGDYALRANSLPFLWMVNNSNRFNASCYPTNYISINKGLLRALEKDDSALAAVFAHEMIHGLMQHSAHSYAEVMAGMMAGAMIGANGARIDWERLNGMIGYGVAKNVILPAEEEADEKGFYLMTSAGFHPGGGAMAMSRMNHYLRYETTDIFELASDEKDNKTVSDHPETEDREKKLAALMTEYGVGHVEVRESSKVYLDGKLIFTAKDTGRGYDNRPETAYGIAGGLSKAFHDYDSFEEWNFTKTDYLTKDAAYKTLKENLRSSDLEPLIKAAYQTENRNKRDAVKSAEEKRHREALKTSAEALNVPSAKADLYRYRCDAYSDYLMGDHALAEIARANLARNQSNPAECMVMEARALAAKGDYKAALELASKGIAKDGKNEYNYLNRADIYHIQGQLQEAIKDVRAAINVNEKNFVSWKVLGNLLEESGDLTGATEAFKKAHEIDKKGFIPLNYLKDMDPKAYEAAIKNRIRAEKQLIEEYNEKYKDSLKKKRKKNIKN
ncbi:MAG: M48 family metalloprotease [Selenomonadaceae bacterium]|nr:M48 family metalloprotease [Selenomonadaceae bacterium]